MKGVRYTLMTTIVPTHRTSNEFIIKAMEMHLNGSMSLNSFFYSWNAPIFDQLAQIRINEKIKR